MDKVGPMQTRLHLSCVGHGYDDRPNQPSAASNCSGSFPRDFCGTNSTRVRRLSTLAGGCGERGLTLLCGCCHAGLLNTLEQVRRTFGAYPRLIAGGAHLVGTHLVGSDATGIAHVAARLRAIGVIALYPNHCTGTAAYVSLATTLGERVRPCPAGTTFEV